MNIDMENVIKDSSTLMNIICEQEKNLRKKYPNLPSDPFHQLKVAVLQFCIEKEINKNNDTNLTQHEPDTDLI